MKNTSECPDSPHLGKLAFELITLRKVKCEKTFNSKLICLHYIHIKCKTLAPNEGVPDVLCNLINPVNIN